MSFFTGPSRSASCDTCGKKPEPAPVSYGSFDGTPMPNATAIFEGANKDNCLSHCLLFAYAPWCVHCQRAEPEFAKFSHVAEALGVATATVNCEQNAHVRQELEVTGYPTVVMYDYLTGTFEPVILQQRITNASLGDYVKGVVKKLKNLKK
jgi:thiol-disulfide isomerase/thioredoxin